jgi:hypothetical protein
MQTARFSCVLRTPPIAQLSDYASYTDGFRLALPIKMLVDQQPLSSDFRSRVGVGVSSTCHEAFRSMCMANHVVYYDAVKSDVDVL